MDFQIMSLKKSKTSASFYTKETFLHNRVSCIRFYSGWRLRTGFQLGRSLSGPAKR